MLLCIKHNFQLKLVCSIHSFHPVFPLSLQLVFEWFINRDIKRLEFFSLNRPEWRPFWNTCLQLFSSWPQVTRWSVHKYIHTVTKVMCALYVRCALFVLQKECRKVWGARYTLSARYRSENMVFFRMQLFKFRVKHLSVWLYREFFFLINIIHWNTYIVRRI